jgi:hypothetical protein
LDIAYSFNKYVLVVAKICDRFHRTDFGTAPAEFNAVIGVENFGVTVLSNLIHLVFAEIRAGVALGA